MKKIMFNDKYGLTQAVLDGRKAMTRRMVCTKDVRLPVHLSYDIKTRQFLLYDACLLLVERSRYAFDEVVAIAQAYIKGAEWAVGVPTAENRLSIRICRLTTLNLYFEVGQIVKNKTYQRESVEMIVWRISIRLAGCAISAKVLAR